MNTSVQRVTTTSELIESGDISQVVSKRPTPAGALSSTTQVPLAAVYDFGAMNSASVYSTPNLVVPDGTQIDPDSLMLVIRQLRQQIRDTDAKSSHDLCNASCEGIRNDCERSIERQKQADDVSWLKMALNILFTAATIAVGVKGLASSSFNSTKYALLIQAANLVTNFAMDRVEDNLKKQQDKKDDVGTSSVSSHSTKDKTDEVVKKQLLDLIDSLEEFLADVQSNQGKDDLSKRRAHNMA